MSDRSKNALIASLIAVLAIAIVALTATYESPDNRVERIGNSIKCPVCQGESIANSPASMAQDMMDLVEARVTAGVSDQAIIDELLGSFTGAVLLDPPASGSTLFLWLAPLAALLAGIGVIWWWRRHPGVSDPETAPAAPTMRRWTGAIIVLGGFALVLIVAGAFLQDRAGTTSGAAQVGVDNLDDVSNETMEAVIAANLDNPQVNGMRLALAERYFSVGDYQSAFPHFLSVAESGTATNSEAATALIRLGWMAYDGNGEVEAATSLLDQALTLAPGSSVALYLKAQVLWCGASDIPAATQLFEEVLGNPDLPSDTRDLVQRDLDAANAGASCS